MPKSPTYPGVYVQEVPGGVRPIAGVATSITAFMGRAAMGPVNEATPISSFGDFERIFGGLWAKSTLGFAVRDFYLNGGGEAVIVRLTTPNAAVATFPVGGITFQAANEGQWGNALRVAMDLDVTEVQALSLGLTKADLFNLTVRNTAPGGRTERFANVTVKANHARNVAGVLDAESSLLRVSGTLPTVVPAAAAIDPISTAEHRLGAATKALQQREADLLAARNAMPAVAADITARAMDRDHALTAFNDAKASVKAAADSATGHDGDKLTLSQFLPKDGEAGKKGLYALDQADIFNLLCIPPYTSDVVTEEGNAEPGTVGAAAAYCEKRRAMLIVDPPKEWNSKTQAASGITNTRVDEVGTRSRNAALFFPRLRQPNPVAGHLMQSFAPCGAMAGIMAKTDATRGVWKAPAGLDARLIGVPQLSVQLTDLENGELNSLAVNCLRAMPGAGRVVWGARTLAGDDRLGSEWKYIPVRRTALYIEESLQRGTRWVVFEPNDEALWAQIRLNVGAFMHDLFRQGALQGNASNEAYFVKCDKETTTRNDIGLGIVNIQVGFAPLKPAEFIVLNIQQVAGPLGAVSPTPIPGKPQPRNLRRRHPMAP